MASVTAECADAAGFADLDERRTQVIYGAYICLIVAAIFLAIACMPAGSVDNDKRGGK